MIDHKSYVLALRARAVSLSVSPAPQWAFIDVPYTPVAGVTYIGEDYAPGSAPQVTVAHTGGELLFSGIYVLRVNAPAGGGFDSTGKYVKGILGLFPPGSTLAAGTQTIRIRSNPAAPYAEGLRNMEGGRAMVPVNIPFQVMTPNAP